MGPRALDGTDAMVLAVIAAAWKQEGYDVLSVVADLQSMPAIDGAGPASRFCLLFIYGWNQHLWPILVTTDERFATVVAGIKRRAASADADPVRALVMTAAVLARLPPVLAMILMQRLFVKGLVESEGMAEVALEGVSKSGRGVRAVSDVSLAAADGASVVLVGPSGRGKSTPLRLVAGLEDATAGEAAIGRHVVNDREAADRGIAMASRSYALYPHVRVRGTLAYGLGTGGMARTEIDRRVEAARLQIGPLLDRYPRALSGGQRQRVAIGRAIVREPEAVLSERAALEPRRRAARGDRPPPRAARHHHGLRDPRPDGGHDRGRPAGGDVGGRMERAGAPLAPA